MPQSNRRAHFRVSYPAALRPRLVVGASICEVVDCSERGVRFRLPALDSFPPGVRVDARLRFLRGDEVLLRGTIAYTDGSAAALRLEGEGIPFASILREQIHLRRVQRQQADDALSSGG
jgi:hypothetical protein